MPTAWDPFTTGKTAEVVSMTVCACSEQASATSGAALRDDGGVGRSVA